MRLGIDLGTTRTIVAAHDRGNFPVVGFTSASGDLCDHYPTVTAEVEGALVHGLDAETAALAGAPALRSWKRLLHDLGPQGLVRVGRVEVPALELVTGFLSALRRDLFLRSNLPRDLCDPLEAAVSVPANAHSTQRFLTLEAFRRAGFVVRAVLNEPSAAGVEFAHRHARALSSRREHVVVYDLGGGTFDAALVLLADGGHEVITTSGVSRLGGDDFDESLLEMALAAAGLGEAAIAGEGVRAALLDECRVVKEALHPTSRRIVLELRALGDSAPASPLVLDVASYYERTRPLVERTLAALEPVLRRDQDDASRVAEVAGIYVVGGASGLPVVPRTLRERFGRRVHRSPHPPAPPPSAWPSPLPPTTARWSASASPATWASSASAPPGSASPSTASSPRTPPCPPATSASPPSAATAPTTTSGTFASSSAGRWTRRVTHPATSPRTPICSSRSAPRSATARPTSGRSRWSGSTARAPSSRSATRSTLPVWSR
ncbi:MAG: Hsp70 family protein [Polyangiaceae bacterium]